MSSIPQSGGPFSLVELLGRGLEKIEIVDVGALWVPGQPRPYEALIKGGAARVVGFEPVQAECDRLNGLGLVDERYLPYFIGDGSERTYHQTNLPQTGSLYEPNTRLLKRFQYMHEATQPRGTSPVSTRRLDDVPEVTGVDYLKVDVQGAELDVLRGAERLLKGALVVEVEVEFVPMYKDQPLFAEVDQELRRQGYLFHTFTSMSGRAFKPLAPAAGPTSPFRQILWGDAAYVRDFTRLGELMPKQLLKLAAIVHELYASVDLAALALQHHDAKTKGALWGYYMKKLMGAVPEAPGLE